jgi:hypothetical protein
MLTFGGGVRAPYDCNYEWMLGAQPGACLDGETRCYAAQILRGRPQGVPLRDDRNGFGRETS